MGGLFCIGADTITRSSAAATASGSPKRQVSKNKSTLFPSRARSHVYEYQKSLGESENGGAQGE